MVEADDDRAYHIPVLCEQAVGLLVTDPDGIYVDGTAGGGGHSAALLRSLHPGARVLGIDQDDEAVSHVKARFRDDGRMTVVKNNFIHLRSILHDNDIESIDGILLDLGLSSRHVDRPERGFSFQHDGPLDMRMNATGTTTAEDLLRRLSREELARVFHEFGEERHGGRIADAIVSARSRREIAGTLDLAGIIRGCVPGQHASKTLARVFQALRIAVNDELEVLRAALTDAFSVLRKGGRMAVISYHSLEDRIVKQFFKSRAAQCTCPPRFPVCVCGAVQSMTILTRKAIRPDENEIRRNPRARSARLRAGEKIHA
jgi:16S rRNA (cytosine1402-N4)-methyltransferase